MLEDVAGIRKVVLACGAVDLRKGIDGLAMIIGDKYKQNPFEKRYPVSVLRSAFRPHKKAFMDGHRIPAFVQTL